MRTSPRSPVGTERLFWKIPGDEREHSREIAVVMLFPTWQMLDPEAPFGWRTRNFPGLASRSNHKHVHFGLQRWHSRPAVPLHGINAERRAVTSWRHRSEAGSPPRHRGLTGYSRAFERMAWMSGPIERRLGETESLEDGLACLVEIGGRVSE
jgi:hypothetical protein